MIFNCQNQSWSKALDLFCTTKNNENEKTLMFFIEKILLIWYEREMDTLVYCSTSWVLMSYTSFDKIQTSLPFICKWKFHRVYQSQSIFHRISIRFNERRLAIVGNISFSSACFSLVWWAFACLLFYHGWKLSSDFFFEINVRWMNLFRSIWFLQDFYRVFCWYLVFMR